MLIARGKKPHSTFVGRRNLNGPQAYIKANSLILPYIAVAGSGTAIPPMKT